MGWGAFLRSSVPPPLVESVPEVGKLHPMMPGSVIVAGIGTGSQLPHADVARGPEVLPPYDRDISGCHLRSFLCLSQEYQVQVQAGTALGEAAVVRWDTIHLQRGDMLLMVATCRHHGMPALPGAKDGLQRALFNLWTPDAKHRHHQPDTTHLDPPPPLDTLAVAGDLSSRDCPSVDQLLWVGKGAVGRVGLWEGDAAQALFADAPKAVAARPPHLPVPPHLPLPLRPHHEPRRDGGHLALGALFHGGRAPDRDHQGGQRRCGVGDPTGGPSLRFG